MINEEDVDKYIFTGDILFVGDIARPDLLGEELLGELLEMSYNTANKLWNLSDDLIVFTSHIKGSLCGKDLKEQYFSTIGIEKKTNKSFALSQDSEEKYIQNLKSQNLETPSFFKKMAKINIAGPKLLKNIKKPKYLSKDDFLKEFNEQEDYIIDFRHPNCFKSGFIAGSINVYEYSNIILIIGSLLDNESRLFLVGDKKTNFNEIIQKLRRIGFDNVEAILKDDVNELKNLKKFEEKNNLPKKTISLTKDRIGDINIEISQIKNLNLDESIEYEVICKNGYKAMAVRSYVNKEE
jgi:hydroxyacylglutathione hydrolase